jgi:hypothetical protein
LLKRRNDRLICKTHEKKKKKKKKIRIKYVENFCASALPYLDDLVER